MAFKFAELTEHQIVTSLSKSFRSLKQITLCGRLSLWLSRGVVHCDASTHTLCNIDGFPHTWTITITLFLTGRVKMNVRVHDELYERKKKHKYLLDNVCGYLGWQQDQLIRRKHSFGVNATFNWKMIEEINSSTYSSYFCFMYTLTSVLTGWYPKRSNSVFFPPRSWW